MAAANAAIHQYSIANGSINPVPVAVGPTDTGVRGGNTVVSSNGNSNGIVWMYEKAASGNAILHAYDATNVSKELWNSQMNATRDALTTGASFQVPVVIDGKVIAASGGTLASTPSCRSSRPGIVTDGVSSSCFCKYSESADFPGRSGMIRVVEFSRVTRIGQKQSLQLQHIHNHAKARPREPPTIVSVPPATYILFCPCGYGNLRGDCPHPSYFVGKIPTYQN